MTRAHTEDWRVEDAPSGGKALRCLRCDRVLPARPEERTRHRTSGWCEVRVRVLALRAAGYAPAADMVAACSVAVGKTHLENIMRAVREAGLTVPRGAVSVAGADAEWVPRWVISAAALVVRDITDTNGLAHVLARGREDADFAGALETIVTSCAAPADAAHVREFLSAHLPNMTIRVPLRALPTSKRRHP